MKKAFSVILISTTSLIITSCGNKEADAPRIASGSLNEVDSQTAKSYFTTAKSLEAAGKNGKAINAYEYVADRFPLSSHAGEARFRQASLYYKQGDLIKSFDTYQTFIEKHNSSQLYSEAISRQYSVAIAAAKGNIKHNFMGIKSKHAASTCEEMLKKCKKNAPYSKLAPKAQFAIGELYQDRGEAVKAIKGYKVVSASYPESSLAPEALYRAGSLMMKDAENGNRNKASLDRAKNAFLDLRQQYPNHPRAKDAQAKLRSLASSNVQRSYDTAEFYRNKGQSQAALIYYKDVIKASPSGRLHDAAKKRIAELSR